MKKRKQPNLWPAILVSAAFTIIILAYWYNHNEKAGLIDLKKNISSLLTEAQMKPVDRNRISAIEKRINKVPNSKDLKVLYCSMLDTLVANKYQLKKNQADLFRDQMPEFNRFVGRSGNQFVCVLLISAIFTTLIWLSLFTNILRDIQGKPGSASTSETADPIMIESVYNAKQKNDASEVRPPFSLSRTQLAVWITIISCVYTYAILWDHRDVVEISATALLLMGIASGTFAAGAIMDTVEVEREVVRHQDQQTTQNFFRDILTDNNGISIHRFQNVVWTAVAVFIYFYRYSNQPSNSMDALPDLDTTLLALTGISNATYLTLKTRENVSLQKLIQINIKLLIAAAVPEKQAIEALLSDGIEKSEIDIVNKIGEVKHAMFTGKLNGEYTFVASVEPDQLQTIKAIWKGKIADKEIILKGTFQEIIKKTAETETVTITMS